MRHRSSIRLAFVLALLCSLMVSLVLASQRPEQSPPPAPVAFAPAVNYPTARAAVMSAAGDFNGDGASDLATTHWGDQTLVIQLNDGTGAFSVTSAYPSSNGGIWAIDAGDLNHDDTLDLAVAGREYNQLLIYLGAGDGTFRRGATLSISPDSLDVKLGDFNGDSHLDAAITSKALNVVEVRLGRGDGTFQAAATFGVGAQPSMLHLADLSGDGRLDIVTANNGGSASVLLGAGNGSFQSAVTYPAPVGSRSSAVGDINGDGRPDLAISGSQAGPSQVDVFLGDGAGRFTPHSSLPVGAPGAAVLLDINQDGKVDMLVSQASGGSSAPGAVSVFLGNGDATFQPAQAFPAGVNPATLLVRDLNGDSRPDIVTSNYHGYDVSVLLAVPGAAPAAKVYLPLAFDPLRSAFPIVINADAIPVRPVQRQGEIYYSADIRVPGPLPATGRFYLSSSPSVPREAYVDDEIVVLVDNREQYTRQATYPGIVEISRAELEQWVDRPVRVLFTDRFGAVVGSDPLWLIWMN